ncbi:MAG TPA: type 4a pilus biogenesis protein PilO [Oligoflexus sp.]|uniref:type 4a pilus biogenesis protein PilO n=1 Tax=Oligoflexus sp. TaxID=1971216 RepID=UPI002D61FF17|nr:type 4a pilus biogenesis protein PilO [Oligoflexus sp.]HYX39021.1 type 4a pilus biogenesis protein PilO [Oligoflexus sp.]
MELEDLIDKYRNSKRQMRYSLVGLLALLPALNTWFNQGEALEARRLQAEADVNEERQKFEAAKQKVAELPALMAKLSEIEDELNRAKQILPDRIEMDGILASLGNLEKELDVKIVKFTPGQEYQPNVTLEYKEMPVDLVLQAPFSQTMRFLDRLVHMPNLTHVRNIQFGNSIQDMAKKSDTPVLETSARLILFKGM